MSDKTHVPSFLTRGMDDEAKKHFEDSYRAAAHVLRKIKEDLNKKVDDLVKQSEEQLSHEEYMFNAAERRALRKLEIYLP